MPSDVLKKQLELVRFERAIDYIKANAGGQKHLTTQELAHINNLITHTNNDPWRREAATVNIPGGRRETFHMLNNPMLAARDLLSDARTQAGNGEIEEAATFLYTKLVLGHFFQDANRRTAVAATYWLLLENHIEIPAIGLLELGLGDVRAENAVDSVRDLLRVTIQFARGRKP